MKAFTALPSRRDTKVSCILTSSTTDLNDNLTYAMMQLKGWNDVQPDVLQKIMGYLTAEEVWNARRASRVWASAVRKVACFSVSIPASLETVQNKLITLSRRRVAATYPAVSVSVSLPEPLQVHECLQVLADMRCLVRRTSI